jgi:hypothetical protein
MSNSININTVLTKHMILTLDVSFHSFTLKILIKILYIHLSCLLLFQMKLFNGMQWSHDSQNKFSYHRIGNALSLCMFQISREFVMLGEQTFNNSVLCFIVNYVCYTVFKNEQ